jgi:ArsR family transcriptional regulator
MNCEPAQAPDPVGDLAGKVGSVADFLQGLANRHRLLVLCVLSKGEHSVGELIALTGIAPTSMSQHLAKLKAEGIVGFRRDHRSLHYFIAHPAVTDLMAVLHARFCGGKPS